MSSEKKVILVVDDAPDNIQLLSGLLKADYKIKAATSGEKALTIANKTPHPDLVLLDVVMPGMDGYEVCKRLKQADPTKYIPIVFVSGNITDEDKKNGRELGAAGFVGKPVNPDELIRLVQDTLAKVENKYA